MAVSGLSAVIIWTNRLTEMIEFYKALGLPLEEEVHDEGPVHFACEIGNLHFAIFTGKAGDSLNRGEGGCTQIGLFVDDVDHALAIARSLSSKVVWEPRDMPWGRAALLCDPDGRPVELNSTPR